MRWVWLLALFVVTACSPYTPTGYASIEATSLDGKELIVVEIKDDPGPWKPVLITVYGDAVLDRILVDGRDLKLGGQRMNDLWIENKGDTVIHLEPGQHEILAYSCVDVGIDWECGCKSEDDCGHWLKKPIYVPSS